MTEQMETVVMAGAPRERGDPEADAARNDEAADRYWRDSGPADLRVHPVVVVPWPFTSARMRRGGFKR
jgi:hypothetical protein